MPAILPPYALAPLSFRFRHLAALAGRAPIGGAREVALACFVAARLAADLDMPFDGEGEARTARCAGARTWVGTLNLPAPVRTLVLRCAEATQQGKGSTLSHEIAALADVSAQYLDANSRGELEQLSQRLKG